MRKRLLIAAAFLCCAASCLAQESPWVYPAGPQESAKLTVWIIVPQTRTRLKPLSRAAAAAQPDPLAYKEQTAGTFGQTAGTAGQTAGSTGTTMGNFGQTAGSVGQTSGSTGQTSGGFQGNVGSRNAGDSGKTMGDFGTSTTDLAKAAAAANAPRNGLVARHDEHWASFESGTAHSIPKVEITFVDVFDDELEARLADTANSDDAPDVLLGNPLPVAWSRPDSGLVLRYGLLTLWQSIAIPQTEEPALPPPAWRWPDAAILTAAHNPQSARAFAVWVEGGGGRTLTPPQDNTGDPVAAVALRAMRSLLMGGGAGSDADPDYAEQSAGMVLRAGYRGDDTKLRIDAMDQAKLPGLTAVAVRAIGTGPAACGVLRAVVMLRRDAAGQWRVLQISPFLTTDGLRTPLEILRRARTDVAPLVDSAGALRAVAQVSPPDGDTRSPYPQLWWDNPGGAALQVVEWQRVGDAWGYSNLYFVPDANSRLRTQVAARFAQSGSYRWRIWSVAKDGTTLLSGWRALNIIGR